MNPVGVSLHLAERKASGFPSSDAGRQVRAASSSPPSTQRKSSWRVGLLAGAALVAQLLGSVAAAAPTSVVSLSGAIAPGQGDDLDVTTTVAIADGYHINAHDPGADYLVPTELTLSGDGLTFTPPQYPPAAESEFAFAPGQRLRVYTGQITIEARASGRSAGGLHAKLRYQACDATHCLKPAVVEVDFRVPAAPPTGVAGRADGAADQAGAGGTGGLGSDATAA
jgi:Disulphide bond corrector protein DsbC